MLRVGINGAAGRMGRRLVALVSERDDMIVVAALECDDSAALGRDAGQVAGIGPINVPVTAEIQARPDVLMDFSSPDSTVARARECAKAEVALVVGTTGLDAEQVSALEEAARAVPCVYAPNMSVGVNVLAKLAKLAAHALGPDFDVEVIEAHHRFKKDAPSGTALKLARAAAEGLGRELDEAGVYGRHGIVGERTAQEIGVHAVRAGDIVGEHTVLFGALGEHVELKHSAHSRDTFVRGALRAARFIAGKKPGMYTMEDVLGIS
ncbi:MAG: 4-hydroxy-tetrahydrodipicolinate reductase [Planctomycetota bacterium]